MDIIIYSLLFGGLIIGGAFAYNYYYLPWEAKQSKLLQEEANRRAERLKKELERERIAYDARIQTRKIKAENALRAQQAQKQADIQRHLQYNNSLPKIPKRKQVNRVEINGRSEVWFNEETGLWEDYKSLYKLIKELSGK